MADSGDWQNIVANGPAALMTRMYTTDAILQSQHPNWPTGGTAAQASIESNFNNDAVSPKGAVGLMQFEPATFNAVKQQMGRPGMDIHNAQDQLDAHQYLMMQNLNRTKGDVDGSNRLYNSGNANADNPETNNYVSQFRKRTGMDSPNQGTTDNPQPQAAPADPNAGWQDVGKAPAEDDGWKDVGGGAQSSALGSFARGAEASAIPSAAGLAAFGPGFAGGAALGALTGPLAPVASPVLGLAGGLATSYGAGELTSKAQDYLLQHFPEAAKAIGLSPEQRQADIEQHPIASFAGGLAPQALAMRPSISGLASVPGIVRAGAGAALGGGQEAAQETAAGQGLNPTNIAMAAGAGALLNKPTAIGRALGMHAIEPGAPAESAAKLAPEAPDEAAAPSAQMPPNMGPNEGPPRPPIYVNARGEAVSPLEDPNMRAYVEAAQQQQRMAQSGAPGYGPQPNLDTMGPNAGPQLPPVVNPRETAQGEFVGPGRPAISVNAQGVATDPLGDANMAQYVAEAQQRIANANGDLFPQDQGGQASPYNPNRLSEEVQQPWNPNAPKNLRQGELGLQTEEPLRYGTERGDLGTAEQLNEPGYQASVGRRIQIMQDSTPEQLDIFSDLNNATHPYDQYSMADRSALQEGYGEAPRSLSSDEFEQTIQNLADKDSTRWQIPDVNDPAHGPFLDAAYQHYIDTVRDAQGQMFDRPTMAKNFADLALQDSIERRIGDHPTVKANAARAASAQARVDANPTPGNRQALEQAQATLQKSVDNIGNYFKETAKQLAPWEKDGIVYMNTFGDVSTLVKSLGAVLKGIHGVVFKTLDRAIKGYGNLDSGGKIFGQGIKDAISRQANRDWSQTVNEKPIEQLSKVAGIRKAVNEMNPFAQESLSPEELKAQFNTAPDLGGGMVSNFLRNNFLPGGLMISDFSQHPLVKYVTDQVANGQRNASKWVRNNLLDPKTGLRSMYKKLSSNAMTEMWTLKEAYEGTKEFTAAELKHRGYSDEQAAAYARTNELQKEAFSNYNEARVRAGEAPMDPRIAHIASYFTGDFRIQVKDAEGRMITSIGHNTKFGVQTIAQRFKELHPDGESLQFGKPTLNRMQGGSDASFHGFMNILQELSKTNADVGRLVQSYRDTQMANTMKLSQMMNRGKFKSNAQNTVGGAEGSKLWQSMEKNAQDGVKQQFKYLESMAKWTELQKAVDNGTKFIDDPEVNAPNAKAVSQKYLDNQMHRNLGALNDFTNSFMSGVAEVTGVGPTAMRSLAAGTKTGLLNMFVGLINFKHSMVTLTQPIWGIPPVNAVMQARGAAFGKAQVLSVFKSLMSNKDILQGMVTKQDIKDPFVRAANQFAKDNDTFNTSQFQMGSVSKPATKLGTAMHINVTVPESGTRAFTYMYYAHMLKDTVGDAMSDKEIFGTAHNATQKVMGDYGQEAQAAIYNKMGFLGGLTKMLTTFKMNQVGQFATASKMFRHGQITPMVATLASSLAAAGLRGFIGYNIANAALGQLTTWASKNGIMEQPTNLDQIILHSLHGMNKGLADALNFGAMSGLGIDMTGSLSHADDLPMDPIGTLMPEGNPITKMIGSAFKLAQQPNMANAKAAAYDIAPNSAKGLMENQMFTTPNGDFMDPHTGNQVSNRTPLDQAKRLGGFRPLEESKLKLEANVAQGHEQQLAAVRNNIITRVLREADSNGGSVPNITKYAQQYEAAGGDTTELAAALTKHNGVDKALNVQQRQQGMATGNYTNAEKYVRSQGFKQP